MRPDTTGDDDRLTADFIERARLGADLDADATAQALLATHEAARTLALGPGPLRPTRHRVRRPHRRLRLRDGGSPRRARTAARTPALNSPARASTRSATHCRGERTAERPTRAPGGRVPWRADGAPVVGDVQGAPSWPVAGTPGPVHRVARSVGTRRIRSRHRLVSRVRRRPPPSCSTSASGTASRSARWRSPMRPPPSWAWRSTRPAWRHCSRRSRRTASPTSASSTAMRWSSSTGWLRHRSPGSGSTSPTRGPRCASTTGASSTPRSSGRSPIG